MAIQFVLQKFGGEVIENFKMLNELYLQRNRTRSDVGVYVLYILIFIFSFGMVSYSQTKFYEVVCLKASSSDVPICAMVKNGGYLYVSSSSSFSCLKTYNIQDPEKLFLTDSMYYTSSEKRISDLSVYNNQLYTIGENGLTIYSLTDPAHPDQIASIKQIADGSSIRNVNSWSGIRMGDLYLCESGWLGLMSINILNLQQPVFNNLITHTGVLKCITPINDTTALFCDGYNAYLLNLSNPGKMTKTTVNILGDPNAVCYNASKNVAYISTSALSWKGVFVIDISNCQIIDSLEIGQYDIGVSDMSLKNSDTLLVGSDDGQFVINCSDSRALSVIEYYNTPYYGGAKNAVLSLDDNYFIGASYSNLCVYKWGTKSATHTAKVLKNQSHNVFLYQNPDKKSFTVAVPVISTVRVVNMCGQKVQQKSGIGRLQIESSNISVGMYYVEIKSNDNLTVKTIMVQN